MHFKFGKMYHQEIAFTLCYKSSVAFRRKFYTLIVQCYNFLAERMSKTIRYDKLRVTLICSRCIYRLDLFRKIMTYLREYRNLGISQKVELHIISLQCYSYYIFAWFQQEYIILYKAICLMMHDIFEE